jgi:hypothetical protein
VRKGVKKISRLAVFAVQVAALLIEVLTAESAKSAEIFLITDYADYAGNFGVAPSSLKLCRDKPPRRVLHVNLDTLLLNWDNR